MAEKLCIECDWCDPYEYWQVDGKWRKKLLPLREWTCLAPGWDVKMERNLLTPKGGLGIPCVYAREAAGDRLPRCEPEGNWFKAKESEKELDTPQH